MMRCGIYLVLRTLFISVRTYSVQAHVVVPTHLFKLYIYRDFIVPALKQSM